MLEFNVSHNFQLLFLLSEHSEGGRGETELQLQVQVILNHQVLGILECG